MPSTAVMQRSAIIEAPGKVVVIDTPLRGLTAGETRVEIAYSGICGSDLHNIDNQSNDQLKALGRRVTPGHEQSGVVVEVADGVSDFAVGTRVCVLPRVPCGKCDLCRRGKIGNCRNMRRPDSGSWAETMSVDQAFLVRLPETLSLREAALAEPTACVLRAIDRAAIEPGASALIIGSGPMGLILAQLLPLCGIKKVLVSEPHPERRRLAAATGARVFDPSEGDLVDWVRGETGSLGVDVAFEAAGFAFTVEQAIQSAAVGGTVVVLGVASPSAISGISPHLIFDRELTIRGAWGVETTFTRAVTLLDRLDLENIITHVFGLEEAADAVSISRDGSSGKVLIQPNRKLATQ